MNENMIHEALLSVRQADAAIIEAQANSSSSAYQNAKNMMLTAEDMLHKAGDGTTEEEKKSLHRAKEYMKHLKETQAAIEDRQ
ncbi:hypothetical protein ACFQPF_08635 [Fictibacillus iocasae]|uniref:Uncharacterized protein n=1 Tax=Fictibacillus iocasae TaxID=2715437 RepID=A0ABW2NQB5_9BACL